MTDLADLQLDVLKLALSIKTLEKKELSKRLEQFWLSAYERGAEDAREQFLERVPRPVKPKHRKKIIRPDGIARIKPRGLEKRLGISPPTRWRWEKSGALPPRDVYGGGRAIGWRPETLEKAERGSRDKG